MKIGMQTWGTRGDVEPFFALGRGLAEAGHEVRLLVTTQADLALPEFPGLSVERVGAVMTQADGDELLDQVIAQSSPLAQAKLVLKKGLLPSAHEMYDAALELAADSDLIVRHHFLYMAQAAAMKLGKPEVSVFLTPDLLPTKVHPPTGMPSLGPLQSAAWWLADKGISSVFGPSAAALRERAELPKPTGVLRDIWPSATANLVAVSPAMFQRPADWPSNHHLTGFWHAPSSTSATMSEDLEAFFQAGSPPVYASFGSIGAGSGPRRASDAALFIEAARIAGVRLVLQQPPGETTAADDVLHVSSSPHALVFPRCAAVIHHGGAGTTQMAVRAKVPSVVVPHLADQFFWAAQVEWLGVGVSAPARSKITAKSLAAAITRALDNAALGAAAARLSSEMANEDGIGAAVAVCGSLV